MSMGPLLLAVLLNSVTCDPLLSFRNSVRQKTVALEWSWGTGFDAKALVDGSPRGALHVASEGSVVAPSGQAKGSIAVAGGLAAKRPRVEELDRPAMIEWNHRRVAVVWSEHFGQFLAIGIHNVSVWCGDTTFSLSPDLQTWSPPYTIGSQTCAQANQLGASHALGQWGACPRRISDDYAYDSNGFVRSEEMAQRGRSAR